MEGGSSAAASTAGSARTSAPTGWAIDINTASGGKRCSPAVPSPPTRVGANGESARTQIVRTAPLAKKSAAKQTPCGTVTTRHPTVTSRAGVQAVSHGGVLLKKGMVLCATRRSGQTSTLSTLTVLSVSARVAVISPWQTAGGTRSKPSRRVDELTMPSLTAAVRRGCSCDWFLEGWSTARQAARLRVRRWTRPRRKLRGAGYRGGGTAERGPR